MTRREALNIIKREAQFGADARLDKLRKDKAYIITDRDAQTDHLNKIRDALAIITQSMQAIDSFEYALDRGNPTK